MAATYNQKHMSYAEKLIDDSIECGAHIFGVWFIYKCSNTYGEYGWFLSTVLYLWVFAYACAVGADRKRGCQDGVNLQPEPINFINTPSTTGRAITPRDNNQRSLSPRRDSRAALSHLLGPE